MNNSEPHDAERRRYPRVRAKIPIELTCTGAPPMRTATEEISLCGCYIETMFTMDIGTKLGLVFSLNQEKIEAKGVVATKYPQVGNGIDYIAMAPEDRLRLGQYLAKCEQETG